VRTPWSTRDWAWRSPVRPGCVRSVRRHRRTATAAISRTRVHHPSPGRRRQRRRPTSLAAGSSPVSATIGSPGRAPRAEASTQVTSQFVRDRHASPGPRGTAQNLDTAHALSCRTVGAAAAGGGGCRGSRCHREPTRQTGPIRGSHHALPRRIRPHQRWAPPQPYRFTRPLGRSTNGPPGPSHRGSPRAIAPPHHRTAAPPCTRLATTAPTA
jgi:hypothetical protein